METRRQGMKKVLEWKRTEQEVSQEAQNEKKQRLFKYENVQKQNSIYLRRSKKEKRFAICFGKTAVAIIESIIER